MSLSTKISPSASLRLGGAPSLPLWDCRLITATSQQVDHLFFFFFLIVGHITERMEGGRRSSGAAGRGSSSSRLSGLGSAASVAERTVPVFVPVPVSRCHTEARRHCFRIGCRRSAAAPPPPSQPGSLSLSPSDLAARGRQGGELGQRESRRPDTPSGRQTRLPSEQRR